MRHTTLLNIVVSGDEPPSEFRIFSAGTVETLKGTFTFDARAAKSVMSEYEAHGIDLMIDYDHASLASLAVDPALSGKAAGWFNLQVRNGELWAVNVRWTQPAADALRRKEWRFMSPAFHTDDGRITSLLNVAITNMPATRRLQPLMAASAGVQGMDPKLVQQALDALISGDSKSALEILQNLIASAAGADPDAQTEDAPPPAGDGGADENVEAAAPAAPPAAAAPAEDPSKKKQPPQADATAAAASLAMAITGKSDPAEAIAALSRGYKAALKIEEREQKLAADRAALEATERRGLVAELVKIGVEIPATAWSDEKGSVPCKRLAAEPIDELRDRVKKLSAARSPASPRPPARVETGPSQGAKDFATPHGTVTLSARELALCEETGAKPEDYAANKAIQLAAQKRG